MFIQEDKEKQKDEIGHHRSAFPISQVSELKVAKLIFTCFLYFTLLTILKTCVILTKSDVRFKL